MRILITNDDGINSKSLFELAKWASKHQNSERISWSAEEVDNKLHYIMENIHENCVKYGTEEDGYVNYVKGANIAGFMKVAKAMMAQGIV